MLKHIVFYKFNEPVEENFKTAKALMYSMSGKIPLIKSLYFGNDVLHSERSFDAVLEIEFESLDALKEYKVNPYHVLKVQKFMHGVVVQSASVDSIDEG